MTASGPGSTSTMSTLFEGRRPSPINAPPSGGEIKKLRERLLKHAKERSGGLTPAACEFLAGAVVSPAAVRQQLSRPTVRPTATGYLEVIYATVPIDCLAPDPTNGRVVGATAWPASDLDDGQTLKLWAPADMTTHPDSVCEVLLKSLATIKTVIEDAAEHTKKLNREMKDKIEQDGILDPLLCQITHIQTWTARTRSRSSPATGPRVALMPRRRTAAQRTTPSSGPCATSTCAARAGRRCAVASSSRCRRSRPRSSSSCARSWSTCRS